MWLMGKSQSRSRNVSLRYFMQVLAYCSYTNVKIRLGSLFSSDINMFMHVWKQIDLV